MSDALKRQFSLKNLSFALSVVLIVWLVWYFYTGFGGSRQLATNLIPLAIFLQVLFIRQQNELYPRLPTAVINIIVVLYGAICVYAFYYFYVNFEEIAIYRQGSYTTQDYIVGLLMFLLVMELSRVVHPTLFWVNMVMIVYTLWGYLSPLDFFWHPGVSFYRVVTSSTLELATGIYGLYGQLALTVIAAFLLLAGVANGFNAQHAMINVVRLVARSRRLIPQTAVVGSSAIGLISGSGSANAAVVGTITIPLMIRYGVPPTFAAAVETAASMGGLIDPPMMGAAAFLMAEFMGVSYWEVVLRGFGFSFVYYISVGVAVYLLCVRLLPNSPIERPKVPLYDKVTTTIFLSSVIYLIYLMGFEGRGELLAALYTAVFMLVPLIAVFLYFKHVRKDPDLADETLFGSFRRGIETHAEMTTYLTLLFATLGIMIGLFTVTGFINRMGAMLLDLGAWNVIAMILMAWVFGWLLGAGLPPTATYVIGAVIIVPPMLNLGINIWVAHFFVFFLSVWGELSPPTSLTAAVSARIANASFMRTMYEALKICAPITLLTFAIFTRSDLVVSPGWAQIAAVLLVTVSTCGVAFSMFGRFTKNRGADFLFRVLLAVASFVIMFFPNTMSGLKVINISVGEFEFLGMTARAVPFAFGVLVLGALIYGITQHRQIAGPKTVASPIIREEREPARAATTNLASEG